MVEQLPLDEESNNLDNTQTKNISCLINMLVSILVQDVATGKLYKTYRLLVTLFTHKVSALVGSRRERERE